MITRDVLLKAKYLAFSDRLKGSIGGLQKRVIDPDTGETLFFIDFFEWDIPREMKVHLATPFSVEVHFTQGGYQGVTFNVERHLNKTDTPEIVEAFFLDIFKKLACTPYEH